MCVCVCVCVCVSPQLSSLLHKKVLVMLHSDVMPHLTQPRLLLDFLTDSYDTGIIIPHYCMHLARLVWEFGGEGFFYKLQVE